MIPTRLLPQQVVVMTASTQADRYGTQVLTWETFETTTVRGHLQAQGSQETEVGRSQQILRAVCYLDPGAVVTGRNRLQIEGLVYQIDGPPMLVHRLGKPHHWLVNVRQVEG